MGPVILVRLGRVDVEHTAQDRVLVGKRAIPVVEADGGQEESGQQRPHRRVGGSIGAVDADQRREGVPLQQTAIGRPGHGAQGYRTAEFTRQGQRIGVDGIEGAVRGDHHRGSRHRGRCGECGIGGGRREDGGDRPDRHRFGCAQHGRTGREDGGTRAEAVPGQPTPPGVDGNRLTEAEPDGGQGGQRGAQSSRQHRIRGRGPALDIGRGDHEAVGGEVEEQIPVASEVGHPRMREGHHRQPAAGLRREQLTRDADEPEISSQHRVRASSRENGHQFVGRGGAGFFLLPNTLRA